jgi:hypothetical protein
MKDLAYLDKYRMPIPEICLSKGSGPLDLKFNGAFAFAIKGVTVHVVAGRGMGWEHVSCSCKDRTPTWEEMETVKRMFFEDNEVVMQLHVAVEDHINVHPYCLHLWRPTSKLKAIPLPPKGLV